MLTKNLQIRGKRKSIFVFVVVRKLKVKHTTNANIVLISVSKITNIKVISNNNIFLSQTNNNEILRIPVAHGEGNYFADKNTLKALNDNEQIILKYCDEKGVLTDLNGSEQNIAGICDKNKRIFGLMPHPERACENILGSNDGLKMLKGFLC